MILSIVSLWYPDYHVQHYQTWLIYCALLWLAVAVNVFGSSIVPIFNTLQCESLANQPAYYC
jgi:choline transport protein